MSKALKTLIAVVLASSFAWALNATLVATAYTNADLAVSASRIDTVVVGRVDLQVKPDSYILDFGATVEAAAEDSMVYAIVKTIKNGKAEHIGADSLVMRPSGLLTVPATVGETRRLAWVADSLQIETINPMTQDTVDNATFTITAVKN